MANSQNPSNTTALVLVDVIKTFFRPGAALHYDHVGDVVPALGRLLDAARASETLVVHAAERHQPGLADFEHQKIPPHCMVDDPDSDFFDRFRPDGPREVLVPKRRYSAFFATDLALLLREQGVEQVVVAGVKTNVCIRATIQDGFAHGFRMVLPRDATNSNRPHLAEASLEDIDRYFGWVVDLDTAVEALS
ncbi:MAG: isochorismatase family cysteine hydrolase [Pseudomonadota bacterium]